jgi:hypothetical protein
MKVDSLPLLGLDSATMGTSAHSSDHTAKSHPKVDGLHLFKN